MSVDLANVKSLLIVFVMPGCPACEDYKPRFERQVEGQRAHGVPLMWYRGRNQKIPRGVIPVLILDATSQDPSVVSLANQYGISDMPSTLLLTRNAHPVKLEGALEDQQVYDLLASAVYANR